MNTLVAVVGRPNVGKSTLVNRLIGERMAIVDDMPGVTRDRLYIPCDWSGSEFILIDTGGLIFEEEGIIEDAVQKQAWMAVDEAAVILFVVDGLAGLQPVDRVIAGELRQRGKQVILTVNKLEKSAQELEYLAEFYELGLGEPRPISAMHGIGIGDLLDDVIQKLDFPPEKEMETEALKLAIVGKPNVGKSSMINAILGQDRVTVSDIPGTTRDAIDSICKVDKQPYILIDTAGIRKKSKVRYGVEQFAVVRAIKAIHRSDVAILVLDASEPASEQDQRIGGMIADMGKACVLVVNKWDLIENKSSTSMQEHADMVREKLYFLDFASIVYTSAITRKRLRNIFDVARAASEENERRITTGLFNEVLNEIIARTPPPTRKGKRPKISYGTQVSIRPPTFALFTHHPNLIDKTYLRYIERQIRQNFGFSGTPIRLLLRSSR